MLLVPESEFSFPFTGVCTNLNTCVEVIANEVGFIDGHRGHVSLSSKLTEATSINDGATQYQLNVTIYADVTRRSGPWSYLPGGCEQLNRTELPILNYDTSSPKYGIFPFPLTFKDYDMVILILTPGSDGDCVQAFGMPFNFKFMHEDCIPHSLDISSEPTPQPTPEPTTQPTRTSHPTMTSAPTAASTEAPQQPTVFKPNLVLMGVSAFLKMIVILFV